jgi:hypothetical protein
LHRVAGSKLISELCPPDFVRALEVAARRPAELSIVYLCPDNAAPSGGVRVIYRHVDTLNEAGRAAAVLHAEPGFSCTWFEHQTRIVYASDVGLEGAVLVVPEIYGRQLGRLAPSVRKVIFSQNVYRTFHDDSFDPADRATPYLDAEVDAAVVVSEDSRSYLEHAFPKLRVLRTVNQIDPRLFRPAELRRRRVALMPRRNRSDALQVVNVLKHRGVLEGVEVLLLEGLTEREVAAALSDTLVFLSLGTAEGCPTPPKEAMASGCLTVGYDGRGGVEFFRPDIAYPVEPGDIVTFARTVEEILLEHPGDPVPLPAKGRAAAEFISTRHSPERERASVLACWDELLAA